MSRFGAIVVIAVLAAIGLGIGFCQWSYYGEAREVRRLAEGLDGVEVLEVDGNHDLTLESLWLDMRYRGERLYFSNVTPESFEDVDHLCVVQLGIWVFPTRGYDAGQPLTAEHWCVSGAGLDVGPEGRMGRRLERPVRSIPEFLQRLPEMRALAASLPDSPPGLHIGDGETRNIVTATGEPSIHPWSYWVYRERDPEEASRE